MCLIGSMLEGGRKPETFRIVMGVTIGGDAGNVLVQYFVGDNSCEAITKNRSDEIDKSVLIQKSKCQETMYKIIRDYWKIGLM